MTYASKRIIAQLHRFGRKAEVKVRTETGQNEFGNMTDTNVSDRTVIAFKTYPNRNTEVEKTFGDRARDKPVFLVPIGEDLPDPPEEKDHLVYDGQEYEVEAHTPYDTHVEFFGEPVIHEDS
jgi:hypothetical protein